MQTGLIGLGKMGYPLALNLRDEQHDVVAYDNNAQLTKQLGAEKISTGSSLSDLVKQLQGRRVIWMMIPAGKIVDGVLEELLPLLQPHDIVIDGGNSFYQDSVNRAATASDFGVDYLDCGTSGGVEGARHGICAMIGGNKEVFDYCEPLFKSISLPGGYLYCGPNGSGHYVKMVHNGIEYGMMQAIAEGFSLMKASEFNLNLKDVAELWNQGSVVRGWLMELTAKALGKDPDLSSIKGIMHSSGEGQWTLETALKKKVSVPVMALSLLLRYHSQDEENFAGKMVAALRHEFGGHAVEKK